MKPQSGVQSGFSHIIILISAVLVLGTGDAYSFLATSFLASHSVAGLAPGKRTFSLRQKRQNAHVHVFSTPRQRRIKSLNPARNIRMTWQYGQRECCGKVEQCQSRTHGPQKYTELRTRQVDLRTKYGINSLNFVNLHNSPYVLTNSVYISSTFCSRPAMNKASLSTRQ